jgi:adenosylcobinamide kinase / adenosylcobinamide-phosphate guanylyltransferase
VKALVLGGVRSGKSRHAERLALAHGGAVVVIATGTAGDEEMAARIAMHRASRPPGWRVLEEPLALGRVLREVTRPDTAVIVDCLTLWLTNLLMQPDAGRIENESRALHAALAQAAGTVILVSNEVGSGIVPVSELARRFADLTGVMHQQLAEICDRVVLMVAGLPLAVKGGTAGPPASASAP